MTAPVIGKGLDRVDGVLKVTGKATYAAEVEVANIAHAVIVTSGIGRGRVKALDVKAAKASAGVLAVLTHDDRPQTPEEPKEGGAGDRVLQLLQAGDVKYGDQPVAVVVADTLERAQHAARRLAPQYDAEPVAGDLAAAKADAYKPKTAGPRDEPDTAHGDVDAGLASAKFKIDATYTTPIEHHNAMEPHATIAVWQGSDRLTVYDSTQGIFSVRKRLASTFGLEPENVRVINHYVGGGFGSKGSPWSHVVLCAMAAKAIGRPVKLVVTRQQMFALVGHRARTIQRVALGCDAKGKLTAVRHDVLTETSRFDDFVEASALQSRMLYACPNIATSHRAVRLDIPTPTFTRAPGKASGSFALESAMDELAYAAKIDPLQLRIRNHAELDPESNKPWSSKSLLPCYAQAAKTFGWERRKREPRSMRDGRWLVGYGMATATYPARQLPSSARARMRADGTVLVQAGTQDIGTGTYTIMSQIAADTLGVPFEMVSFELGDTELPETPLSAGSFTTSSTGAAVKKACLALADELAKTAIADPKSPLHGLKLGEPKLADGALVAGPRRDPLAAIVTRSGKPEIVAEAKTEISPEQKNYSIHAFGADFVEVRVDEDLGTIRIARMVGAFGCGRIINAKTARSQLAGGMVWAIGHALEEHTVRDPRTGRAVTRDLADYHVPVHADVPSIDVIMIHEDDPYVNEIGAKGLGEIGITGAVAAIANAVYHATGKRVRDLPITVDKLL